jgi:hypothetical protein
MADKDVFDVVDDMGKKLHYNDQRAEFKRTFKTYLETIREALNRAEKAFDENSTATAQFWVDGPIRGSVDELSALIRLTRDQL